jgi:hypothetical protein
VVAIGVCVMSGPGKWQGDQASETASQYLCAVGTSPSPLLVSPVQCPGCALVQ